MSEEKIDEVTTRQRCADWRVYSLFFFMLILAAAIGVLGYFQFTALKHPVTQEIGDLQKQQSDNQEALTGLRQSVATLEQATQHTQSLSDRQEQILNEWQAAQKGNLDKWYVAEAQYLVKLANEQLTFSQNPSSALTLLMRAEQILQNVQDQRLNELRKSLTADITRLKEAPQVDVTTVFTRLTMLGSQLNQLPLPVSPLKQSTQTQQSVPSDESWWKAGLNNTWESLKKLVVIQYNGANALPLVMPQEKPFLYQNMQAQLETAKWGVLHRNSVVYQTSEASGLGPSSRHLAK